MSEDKIATKYVTVKVKIPMPFGEEEVQELHIPERMKDILEIVGQITDDDALVMYATFYGDDYGAKSEDEHNEATLKSVIEFYTARHKDLEASAKSERAMQRREEKRPSAEAGAETSFTFDRMVQIAKANNGFVTAPMLVSEMQELKKRRADAYKLLAQGETEKVLEKADVSSLPQKVRDALKPKTGVYPQVYRLVR